MSEVFLLISGNWHNEVQNAHKLLQLAENLKAIFQMCNLTHLDAVNNLIVSVGYIKISGQNQMI